jgi:ABC-2 type transport system permease protein
VAGVEAAGGEQLRAIALLRWQIFVNSLHSVRGRLNLVSRSIAALLVIAAGVGGGVAIGSGAWAVIMENRLQWLAGLFWIIFLFWQMFPVMATALTQNVDASVLLRFPLKYSNYFLVRLIYGSLDIATALGMCWCAGLYAGIVVARWTLAPWALLIIALFVGFNVLLARTVFTWMEHWLSTRHSREIMGVIFLFMLLAVQLTGPALGRFGNRPAPQRIRTLSKYISIERGFPPGLAANALWEIAERRSVEAVLPLALSVAYVGLVLYLLHRRLWSQYRGENVSAGDKRQELSSTAAIRRGWRLPALPSAVSAVFEKELRYFSRSVPMLFTLIMPLVVIFAMWGGRKGFLSSQTQFLFPIGAAYSLLIMTNIVYNSFGGDGSGVQFFLVSPVPFRQIALAKNLAQLSVFLLDVFILWIGIRFIYHPPNLRVSVFTLAWCLFAVPLNFSAGNLLSIYSPKRIDLATFGRQRASEATILASLAVQITGVGFGVLAVYIAHLSSSLWTGSLVLFGLSIATSSGYIFLLRRIDQLVLSRREVLATELFRS